MKIVVTLCTRRRPVMLGNCLHSLVAQRVPDDVSLSIVVVENNETDACRSIVHEIASQQATPPIAYMHEPRLGIPIARNRTLEMALEQAPDWIAFIDDDEVADPDWIARFAAAATTLEADVLQGPVDWVHAETGTPTKARRHRDRGETLKTAATNNTLMRACIANADGLGLRFDETMRFTGGSDTDFFLRARDRGAVIRWVDDAAVRECVPTERLTFRWSLQRARRLAATEADVAVRRNGRLRTAKRYIPKCVGKSVRACGELAVGALVYPFNKTHGSRIWLTGIYRMCWVSGSLGATFNFIPQPYQTIEGC